VELSIVYIGINYGFNLSIWEGLTLYIALKFSIMVFAEILKYTIPALVVLATAYLVLKQFLTSKEKLALLEYQKEMAGQNLPLKLQAYERLMLLCERIDMKNLVFRLLTKEITPQNLSNGMLVSVQKEYEHNLAQQVYISDSLWKIVTQAKDNVQTLINKSVAELPEGGTSEDLLNILQDNSVVASQSLEIAKSAIRAEIKTIIV
jgi:hypothetical protein